MSLCWQWSVRQSSPGDSCSSTSIRVICAMSTKRKSIQRLRVHNTVGGGGLELGWVHSCKGSPSSKNDALRGNLGSLSHQQSVSDHTGDDAHHGLLQFDMTVAKGKRFGLLGKCREGVLKSGFGLKVVFEKGGHTMSVAGRGGLVWGTMRSWISISSLSLSTSTELFTLQEHTTMDSLAVGSHRAHSFSFVWFFYDIVLLMERRRPFFTPMVSLCSSRQEYFFPT